MKDYNFVETAADERRIIYSKANWVISVYFVPFEYEISLCIAYSEACFEIYSFIEALDPEEFAKTYVLTAQNDDELQSSLESLSSRLLKFGARALDGDPTIMEFVAKELSG